MTLRKITALKERFGIASAQAESLENNLNMEIISPVKNQENRGINGKIDTLSPRIDGTPNYLKRKENTLLSNNISNKVSNNWAPNFKPPANRILDEKAVAGQNNQTALDSLLKPFREQIEGSKTGQWNPFWIGERQCRPRTEIKKVLEIGLNMSQQTDNLTSALKGGKKTRATGARYNWNVPYNVGC